MMMQSTHATRCSFNKKLERAFPSTEGPDWTTCFNVGYVFIWAYFSIWAIFQLWLLFPFELLFPFGYFFHFGYFSIWNTFYVWASFSTSGYFTSIKLEKVLVIFIQTDLLISWKIRGPLVQIPSPVAKINNRKGQRETIIQIRSKFKQNNLVTLP